MSLDLESDPRFPSGPWVGFFLDKRLPGRHWMELHLTFQDGTLTGEGRDKVGTFLVRGRYQLDDGQCWWTKRYLDKHDVSYRGFNEGKGIYGEWELENAGLVLRGGFCIWPKGMDDPTRSVLTEEVEAPVEQGELVGV